MEEHELLLQTIIACLVDLAGGEVRIPLAMIENPPDIEPDDDPYTGDWIYRVVD